MTKTTEQFEELPEREPLVILRWPWYWRLLGGLVVVGGLLFASFQVAYANKIYPGVSADGVYLGGLTREQAARRLTERVTEFSGHALAIRYGDTVMRIPVNGLTLRYDTGKVADLAYNYGRQGDLGRRWQEQLRTLAGRPSNFAAFSYSDERLAPYLGQVIDDIVTPVNDAGLTFNDNEAQVTPAQPGRRLNVGRLVQLIEDRLARTDTSMVDAPQYDLKPVISTEALDGVKDQASTYVSAPITITYDDVVKQIDQATIVSWLKTDHRSAANFMTSRDLKDLYPAATVASVSLSRDAIAAYVIELAKKTDQTPRNAGLTMQDGHVAIAQPSRNGVTLDQPGAVEDIVAALSKGTDERTVALNLKVVRPDVNEDNLESLGIKELISQGETFFPGSTQNRLTNVRVGASKFNGVLLKPGEVFSFGALLGDVGPETGYKPELVILGDHEEKQYGGGLCQVSSTAFRAALLAGLPIAERHSHSFAVSYYTAPFGVPGVDATIFYPQVDFKFKNDTGSYILIQTVMQGTTLKFDYYGTKTKTGTIRGPQFITGTNDTTKPSHTVFYRDVLGLDGKTTKTDTFHTYYKSSLEFPIQTSGFN